jgi:hypothetical protein
VPSLIPSLSNFWQRSQSFDCNVGLLLSIFVVNFQNDGGSCRPGFDSKDIRTSITEAFKKRRYIVLREGLVLVWSYCASRARLLTVETFLREILKGLVVVPLKFPVGK